MKRLFVVGILFFSIFSVPEHDPLYYGHSDDTQFVIRWAYQDFCDHVYDPRTDIWRWPTDEEHGVLFDPAHVKPGDIIFVRMIPTFFEEMHPRITVPYLIVSAGECLEKMKPEYKQYLDEERLIAWFGVHPDEGAMNHPKFSPLPLGIIQDPYHYVHKRKAHNFFEQMRKSVKKKQWLYINFAYEGKPERKVLHKKFIKESYCLRGERKEFKEYLAEMAQCRFTLSPEGLGPDCYRTWEALLVGTIPIVRTSCLDKLYEELPVLIVDDWNDITKDFLKNKYREICSKKYDIKRLYTAFWTDKIMRVKKDFLSGRHSQ